MAHVHNIGDRAHGAKVCFVCHGAEDQGEKKTKAGDDNGKLVGISHCKIEFDCLLFYRYRVDLMRISNYVNPDPCHRTQDARGLATSAAAFLGHFIALMPED